MKISEQLKATRDYLSTGYLPTFAAVIFGFFALINVQNSSVGFWTGASLGVTFYIVLFVMFFFLYDIGTHLTVTTDYKTNFFMWMLFILVLQQTMLLALDFVDRFTSDFIAATSMLVSYPVGFLALFAFYIVPVLIVVGILKIAFRYDSVGRWTIIGLAFLLLSVAIPIITYQARQNINDMLYAPIFMAFLCGIVMVIVAWREQRDKKKVHSQER